jgi:hypothetical protein
MNRRSFNTILGSGVCGSAIVHMSNAVAQYADSARVEEWMSAWMETPMRALEGPLKVQRFVEPIYLVLEPTSWSSNTTVSLPSVTVPRGFVTDFASVPRLFWSLVPPDGAYAHAAVVHDYLYWAQTTKRTVADEIFLRAMNDLKVSPVIASGIHSAVNAFGASAWDSNARLAASGEKRVLRRFPTDPATRWADWKTRADVF